MKKSFVSVLGNIDDTTLIVVVGRSNYKKTSASLDALLDDLHASGFSICWFEPRNTQIARWRDRLFDGLLNGRLSIWCKRHAVVGKQVRRLANIGILLLRPDKWVYFSKHFYNPNRLAARDLSLLLSQIPLVRIHFFTHSAGGIAASQVASTSSVVSIVCFGYPFKHPEKDEEPFRTAHLHAVSKPFLIFQGDQDDYGNAQEAQRYHLSESTVVKSVASGHDYDSLDPSEYRRCLTLLKDFWRGV